MSEITLRVPQELGSKLQELIEKVIRETYGDAFLASLKSYIEIETGGQKLIDLILHEPSKLINYIAKILGGSEYIAYDFLKGVLERMFDEIKEIPEIDIDEVLHDLMKGREEKFQALILELAYKLTLKLKPSIF